MQFGIPMYSMDGAGVENFLRDGIIKLLIILKPMLLQLFQE